MAGGAYLLREREAYDQETAARQEAVLKKLGEEIPGYAEAPAVTEVQEDEQSETTAVPGEAGQDVTSEEDGAGNTSGTGDAAFLQNGWSFPVVSVDDVDCAGILEIPSIGCRIAVGAPWAAYDYMACLIRITVKNDAWAIASENRDSLLGRLPEVSEGDRVYFTDVYGNRAVYQVSAVYSADEIPAGTEPGQQKTQTEAPVLNLCCPQGKKWFVAECTK